MYEIKKHALTPKGKYYVNQNICIYSCCYDIAPANFKWDGEFPATYVFKQPETPEEEAQCQEAKDWCPVEAIFDDGI